MELGRLRMGRERERKGEKEWRESGERKGEGGDEKLNRAVAMAMVIEREEREKEREINQLHRLYSRSQTI